MDKCPKCITGTITSGWEQPYCVNCGHVIYPELELARSRREVANLVKGGGAKRWRKKPA